MKNLLLSLLFLSILFHGFSQTKIDTLTIYFNNDEYKFDIAQLELTKASPYQSINIQAYADSNASTAYNETLSFKRAYFTYFQLLNAGIPNNVIKKAEGKGEITFTENSQEFHQSRRVEIIYTYKEESDKEKVTPIIDTNEDLEKEFTEAQVGDNIKLDNLHFQPGTHLILPKSKLELDLLVLILNNNQRLKIDIQGHICCQFDGRDGYDAIAMNNQLSVNRAYAIYRHLIDHGVEAGRLSFTGFGSSQKIYQNEMNEEEKIANRRVEFIIIEN